MTKRNWILAVTVAGLLSLGTYALHADPPAKDSRQFPILQVEDAKNPVATDKEVAPLMRQKLERAKEILEGLALEDHEMIAASARRLRLLSLEAGWKVVQTKEYMQQSADFRRECDSIEKAAKAEDVSRAAMSYMALTVRCVECHSYLRANKLILTSQIDR